MQPCGAKVKGGRIDKARNGSSADPWQCIDEMSADGIRT
jgi:hypothetical protein